MGWAGGGMRSMDVKDGVDMPADRLIERVPKSDYAISSSVAPTKLLDRTAYAGKSIKPSFVLSRSLAFSMSAKTRPKKSSFFHHLDNRKSAYLLFAS